MSDGAEDFRKLSTSGESLYLILGVEKSSTDKEIKEAYKKLKLELRSDRSSKSDGEGTKMMHSVNRAHSILSDSEKKDIYDSNGSLGLFLVENYGERDANSFCVVASGWCVAFSLLCGSVFSVLLSCFCCCGCCCCCCCNRGCDCWRSSPEQDQDLVEMSTTVLGTGEQKRY